MNSLPARDFPLMLDVVGTFKFSMYLYFRIYASLLHHTGKERSTMIVNIVDQLGNQFFTYASIKCICMDTNQRFQWWARSTGIVNSIDGQFGNTLEGGAFPNIDFSECIEPIENPQYTWVERWPRTTNYLKEPYNLGENDIVRGHFQCPRYFDKYREDVLKWFDLHDDLKAKAREKAEEIRQAHLSPKILVSVHLRRGWDYLREGRLLHEDYYIKAVNKLVEKSDVSRDELVLVLFSDTKISPRFIKKLGCYCVESKGSLFEDLALMQECDHHIISNSTFAWWGAYLDRKDALVLRPSIYPISPKELYPDDIFPEQWISVEAHRISKPVRVFFGKVRRKIRRMF